MVIGESVDFDGDFVVLENQIPVIRADLYVISDCEMLLQGTSELALRHAIGADNCVIESAFYLVRETPEFLLVQLQSLVSILAGVKGFQEGDGVVMRHCFHGL